MRLSQTAVAVAALATLAGPTAATAQASDEWDFGRDPTRDLVIAAVSYENFGVAVRCLDGVLSVVVSGVPQGRGVRTFRYQMGDQTETDSRWVAAGDGTTAFAVWPARTAAGLARGGRLNLGVRDGQTLRRIAVDLPPSTSAVSQVFQACGRELTPRTEADEPDRENLGPLRWRSAPEPSFPNRTMASQGLAALRCSVNRNGRLEDCTVESEFPEGGGFGRAATLGAHRTGRVQAPEGREAEMEGRKVTFVVNYQMGSEDLLPSIPSRLPDRPARQAPDPIPPRTPSP